MTDQVTTFSMLNNVCHIKRSSRGTGEPFIAPRLGKFGTLIVQFLYTGLLGEGQFIRSNANHRTVLMMGLLDYEAAINEDLVDREPFRGKPGKERSWDVLQRREENIIDYLHFF